MKKLFVKCWINRVDKVIEHMMVHEEYVSTDLITPSDPPDMVPVSIPGEPDIIPGYDIQEFEVDVADDTHLTARQLIGKVELTNDQVTVMSADASNVSIINKQPLRNFKNARS